MGRDLGRHTHGDAVAAVHQELGERRGQHLGFAQPAVEVGAELDRVFVDVAQKIGRDRGESRLGVAIRRRRIAIDRSEVTLAVHQRVAHGERLRHPDQRVVHGDVAVRVILAEHVAHDGGALLVSALGGQPQLVHRMQNSPLRGLEPVTRVGQGSLHDHAHRVVDERLA